MSERDSVVREIHGKKYFYPFGAMWAKYRYPEGTTLAGRAVLGRAVYIGVVIAGFGITYLKKGMLWAIVCWIMLSFVGMWILRKYYAAIGLEKLHD